MPEELPKTSDSKQTYIDGLIAGIYEDKTQQEVADIFGVTPRTIYTWDQKVDWKLVTEERRKLYAKDILKTDKAMLKASHAGDVAAAKVVYERFDGWVPTSAILDGKKPDSELLDLAKKKKQEMLGQSQPRPDLPGIGAA